MCRRYEAESNRRDKRDAETMLSRPTVRQYAPRYGAIRAGTGIRLKGDVHDSGLPGSGFELLPRHIFLGAAPRQ